MRLSRIAMASAVAALISIASQGFAGDPAPTTATGSISGTVTGLDHKPAAGVSIKVALDPKVKTPTAADGDKKKKGPAALTATTDSEGKFKVDNVPPGQYAVTASIKGGGGRGRVSVPVQAGKNVDVTIQLTPSKAKAQS